MSEFPKWLLVLAFLSLIPLLICPVFLFGGHPFGTSSNTLISLLLYIATQLLWLLPIAGFFTCLDSWRRGFYKRSIALGFVSLIISITGIALVFA